MPAVVGTARGRETVAAGPAPPGSSFSTPGVSANAPRIPLKPTVEQLSLEQVTLPNFINEVFSKALSLTVQIDQRVTSRSDIVTLRTGGPLPSEELFSMAQKVLAGYGVALSWDGSVLHVAPDDALLAQLPDLIRSRSLPEMPVVLRPVFQVVDLHQVSATDMAAWLTNAYGSKVKVFPAARIAAVMIFGLPENVSAAVEAAGALDQARLAGRQSLRMGLVYWTALTLAAKLADVLRAEGYDVGISAAGQAGTTSTIMLIPVETNNTLIAFAADAKILAHVQQWIGDLDQAGRADPLRGIFIYMVQNTTAASLGQVVQAALGGQQAANGQPTTEVPLERSGATRASAMQGTTEAGGATPGAAASAPVAAGSAPQAGSTGQSPLAAAIAPSDAGGQSLALGPGSGTAPAPRLVIDQSRNALVFVGTAQDYQRVRPLLETLDRAPREALIEVTVAELDLNDSNSLGFDWTQVNKFYGKVQSVGTGPNLIGSAGIPLGSSGFNYVLLNGVGDVRAVLNAAADNNHVSVLSTPRVLAKSGSEAHIEVGTEVPIITSQGTTNTIQNAGTTGILQSIDYRKTGVLLNVKPVIQSGNRIELAVNQEVSAALPNNTPGISSPLIQDRTISTDLTLNDGQTVLIGGMIQENRSSDDNGVPYLKDVPGLGLLFRNQSQSRGRTELLVFITPYVISGEADASAITEQFRNQMKAWPIPSTELHW